MLKLTSVDAHYGPIRALHSVSLNVQEGEIVTLIGANGAGKSTILRLISGLLRPTNGDVALEGRSITHEAPERIVKRGVCHVPEGRRVFCSLTVLENLRMGAYLVPKKRVQEGLDEVFTLFPRLLERRNQPAGTLSGGEQQMLAIGRALMARPRLMLLDEPSLGLAPLLVAEIFDIVKRINQEQRTTILLVEQNARLALSIADYAYIMENGRIVLEGDPAALRDNADVREFYLGLTDVGQRKSYREIKHYKRRKRWLS